VIFFGNQLLLVLKLKTISDTVSPPSFGNRRLPLAPKLLRMKNMKQRSQLTFIPSPNQRFFGGELLKGRRKSRRPFNSEEAIHLVLRSQFAQRANSFRTRKNLPMIDLVLTSTARKCGVKIYRRAIQSNHIHLIITVRDRQSYRRFISIITGKIASLVMNYRSFKNFIKEAGEGSKDIKKIQKGQAFWQFRPFTRILTWGKDFQNCCGYLLQNSLEALGFIAYQHRRDTYRKYLIDDG
jgi:REP element-mobilizing transposase RayT